MQEVEPFWIEHIRNILYLDVLNSYCYFFMPQKSILKLTSQDWLFRRIRSVHVLGAVGKIVDLSQEPKEYLLNVLNVSFQCHAFQEQPLKFLYSYSY